MRHAFPLPVRCTVPILGLMSALALHGADPIFSGPQPGEKTTGFQVIQIGGASDNSERDPVKDNAGAPTVIVFMHAIERSLLPLLRAIDEYGVQRSDRIKTEVVFLVADRISGEQKVRVAAGSLRLKAKLGISPDGAEGPGNYGLNKDCMMTLVMAKDNVVTSSFALVQPGIADAPAVIAALARACGDENPPSVEALTPAAPIARDGKMAERAKMPPAGDPKPPIPGAVPSDAKLTGLLREFIRKTNDDATVDRVLSDVKAHIQDDAALTQQAVDGWTRALHFEQYGSAYARKVGKEFLDSIKKP